MRNYLLVMLTPLVILAVGLGLAIFLAPPASARETTPVVTSVERVPFCYYEDGTNPDGTGTYPCVWDGKLQGNTEGMSYVLTTFGRGITVLRESQRVAPGKSSWTLPSGVRIIAYQPTR